MPLIQSNTNPYGVVDRTDELLIVPNKYGLLQDMGLFKSQGVIGSSFYVDEHEVFTGALVDLPRGTKPAAAVKMSAAVARAGRERPHREFHNHGR